MPDPLAESISLKQRYEETIAAIRADVYISDHLRDLKLANAYGTLRAKLEQLKQRNTKIIKDEKANLERKAFGLKPGASDSAIISYRDAVDRASKLTTPAEARKMLNTAERSGDTALTKAILAHAIEKAWTGLVNEYEGEHGDIIEDVKSYVRGNQPRGRQQEGFLSSIAFRSEPPTEIQGYNSMTLHEMAQDPAGKLPNWTSTPSNLIGTNARLKY